MLNLDNSRRSDYQKCPRKYYYVDKLNLSPLYGSTALRYGSSWHEGMDAFYTAIMEEGWDGRSSAIEKAITVAIHHFRNYGDGQEFYDDYRNETNLGLSLIKYIDEFISDEGMLEVVQPEAAFKIKMYLTDWEKNLYPHLEDFWFTGRIDAVIKLNDVIWQMEHKTTGQSLSIQLSRLNRSPQIIGYTYAGKKIYNNELPAGTLIQMHRLFATKSRSKDPAMQGKYGKVKIEFARDVQSYTEYDLKVWRQSFVHTAALLKFSLDNNWWPMEFDSCFTYGKCPFTELCEQNSSIDDLNTENFITAEHWSPLNNTNKVITVE